MKRIVIFVPDEIAAEISRLSEGKGKRRVILEAICKAWGWSTRELPEDQRFNGTETYYGRKDDGWHDTAESLGQKIGRPRKLV